MGLWISALQLFFIILSILLVSSDKVKNNLVTPKWHFLPIGYSSALSGCWAVPRVRFAACVDAFSLLRKRKCKSAASVSKTLTTPVPLKAVRCTARSFAFAATTFFLKPMWWVWSCIQHTLPRTRSSPFDPRMDFTNGRIKYPAKSILLRPKGEGCNVWISGLMVSHCQERASTGKESTGFPWRQWRSVGNGILKQKVKTVLSKTRWSWCENPAAGSLLSKPSS